MSVASHIKAKRQLSLASELKPSKDMTTEAVGFGFYHSPGWNKDFPKLQILTVEDLLNGKQVQLPPSLHTFKQAERSTSEMDNQGNLTFG